MKVESSQDSCEREMTECTRSPNTVSSTLHTHLLRSAGCIIVPIIFITSSALAKLLICPNSYSFRQTLHGPQISTCNHLCLFSSPSLLIHSPLPPLISSRGKDISVQISSPDPQSATYPGSSQLLPRFRIVIRISSTQFHCG